MTVTPARGGGGGGDSVLSTIKIRPGRETSGEGGRGNPQSAALSSHPRGPRSFLPIPGRRRNSAPAFRGPSLGHAGSPVAFLRGPQGGGDKTQHGTAGGTITTFALGQGQHPAHQSGVPGSSPEPRKVTAGMRGGMGTPGPAPRSGQQSRFPTCWKSFSQLLAPPWDKVLFEGLLVPPWHCQRGRTWAESYRGGGDLGTTAQLPGQTSPGPCHHVLRVPPQAPGPTAALAAGWSIGEPDATAVPTGLWQGGRWAHISPLLPLQLGIPAGAISRDCPSRRGTKCLFGQLSLLPRSPRHGHGR